MLTRTLQLLLLAASCTAAGCTSSTPQSLLAPSIEPAAAASTANATVGAKSGGSGSGNGNVPIPTLSPLPPKIAIVVQGLVSGLLGKCPDRTFVMGNRIVITSGSTVYTAGACDALVFSQRVDVTGVADGFILHALEIRQQKNKDRP
ncbi:MAG: hypothetical protein JWL71_361 [Acidobacteria bacterium]|nr:hypothetical protein [Acidobacteriota bacterium]